MKFTTNYELFIYNDSELRGVAYSKNKCLENLKDCDHIFLFDDDCFPIANGWANVFIDASNRSGNQHFSYLTETSSIKKIKSDDIVSVYNNAAGCLMYFTKHCVKQIGGYNEKFGRYGFEHAELSNRIFKKELTAAKNICPTGADIFIYSMDLNTWLDVPLAHTPTLTTDEMQEALKHSRKVYNENTI